MNTFLFFHPYTYATYHLTYISKVYCFVPDLALYTKNNEWDSIVAGGDMMEVREMTGALKVGFKGNEGSDCEVLFMLSNVGAIFCR